MANQDQQPGGVGGGRGWALAVCNARFATYLLEEVPLFIVYEIRLAARRRPAGKYGKRGGLDRTGEGDGRRRRGFIPIAYSLRAEPEGRLNIDLFYIIISRTSAVRRITYLFTERC